MPANPLTDPNWAPDLADTVERVVATVRDKATGKAVTAVRALVFGLLITVLGITSVVLLVILGTKLLQEVLATGDFIEPESAVGVSYLVMAAVLGILGAICMKMRSSNIKETR